MFKEGEKIVCILNSRGAYEDIPRLYVNKTYTYKGSIYIGLRDSVEHIYIDEHVNHLYKAAHFVTLKEHRKNKLVKLC